jgi:hypothetical protein
MNGQISPDDTFWVGHSGQCKHDFKRREYKIIFVIGNVQTTGRRAIIVQTSTSRVGRGLCIDPD